MGFTFRVPSILTNNSSSIYKPERFVHQQLTGKIFNLLEVFNNYYCFQWHFLPVVSVSCLSILHHVFRATSVKVNNNFHFYKSSLGAEIFVFHLCLPMDFPLPVSSTLVVNC